MPSNIPTYGLRLPPALKAAAQKAAAAEHRSLNNWILDLIDREVSKVTENHICDVCRKPVTREDIQADNYFEFEHGDRHATCQAWVEDETGTLPDPRPQDA